MFYEKTVLDNGITVITEHMEGVRSASPPPSTSS